MARFLPPGFRFSPTDRELCLCYLKRKVVGKRLPTEAISEVDIYKFAPWDLPDKACFQNRDFKWSRDLKWYFFCPREKKYAKGGRINRATDFGSWKTTGNERPVIHGGKTIGMIRSLVFHLRKPQVQRTNWVMHEYRVEDMDLSGVAQDAFVVCMIFEKKGPGPRNGDQYGAPFSQEEWDSDEDVIDSSHGVLRDGRSAPAFVPPNNQPTITAGPSANENFIFGSASNSYLSQVVRSVSNGIPRISGKSLVGNYPVQGAVDHYRDGISCVIILDPSAETQNMVVADLNHRDEDDVYGGLGDLGDSTILNGLGSDHTFTGYPEQNMVDQFDLSEYFELNDLEHPLDPESIFESNDLKHPLDHKFILKLNDLESPLPCPEAAFHSNTVPTFDGSSSSCSFSLACNPCGVAQLTLPPGFRFSPTDDELLMCYLKRKVMGKRLPTEAISEVDIYKFAPWDLPDKACFQNRDFKWSKDLKWYFFCPREKKYAKGGRINRATDFGSWKTTGEDRPVIHGGKTVGMIRSLVFHLRKPQVQRTDWVMHEYRVEDMGLSGVAQDAFVICMIFEKEGPGPRNGAQYGAPFNDEEWDSDEDAIDSSRGVLTDGLSAPAFLPPNNQSTITAGPNAAQNFVFDSTSNSDPSQVVQSTETQNMDVADLNHREEDEIYGGLGDLGGSTILNGLGSDHTFTSYPEQNMVDQFNWSDCLELNDLERPLDQ